MFCKFIHTESLASFAGHRQGFFCSSQYELTQGTPVTTESCSPVLSCKKRRGGGGGGGGGGGMFSGAYGI